MTDTFAPVMQKLADIPNSLYCFVGTDKGEIEMTTQLLYDSMHSFMVSAAWKVPNKLYEYYILTDQVAEMVEIQRVYLVGGWTLRCGYGPRSQRWVVQGELEKRVYDTEYF